MSLNRYLLFLLIILTISVGVNADLVSLNKLLDRDLLIANEYLAYMEAASYSKDILDAKKDLTMAMELGKKVTTEGEVYLRQSRIKLEEFWIKASYSLPATTKIAYIDADELTRRFLSKELKNYLQELASIGFNGVIVETNRRDGFFVYPNSKAEQYRLLHGSDPVKDAEIYAKEFDLDLFLVMNIGFIAEKGIMPNLTVKYPELVALSEAGDIFDEENRIYLNLAHPDVRKYYLDIALELANYNATGIILNIGLPESNSSFNDYSYDSFSRKVFEDQYGYDPLKEKSKPRIEWDEWRREQISSLISQISRRLASQRPEVKLGALIQLEDRDQSFNLERFIDWKVWVSRGYIEYLFPQIYSYDQFNQFRDELCSVKGDFLTYPVYSHEEDISLSEYLSTLSRVQLSGGLVLKNTTELDQFSMDALRKSIFKHKTLSLHRDPWRALMVNVSELELQAPKSWFTDLRLLSDNLSKLVMAPQGKAYVDALVKVNQNLALLENRALTNDSVFDKRMVDELRMFKTLLNIGVLRRSSQGKKLY